MTPLPPPSVAWRLAVLAGVAGFAIWGTVGGNDVDWPFAPMAQFAFRVGADDSVRSTFLQGATADGTVYVVPMTSPTVGMGRAEVEGQIPAMQRDPRLLGELATTYRRLHPGHRALVRLWLRQDVVLLHEGRDAGTRVDLLTTWTAPGTPAAPVPPPPVHGSRYVPR